MQSKVLYNQDGNQWIVIGREPEKDSHVIDTNEYVIINRGHAMLLDPGGIQIFPQVLAELAKYVRMQDIKVIFASHQDPDICSSLAMWLDLNPTIKTYCSWLWTGFVSHFSTGAVITLNPIPDQGMRIRIGRPSASQYSSTDASRPSSSASWIFPAPESRGSPSSISAYLSKRPCLYRK